MKYRATFKVIAIILAALALAAMAGSVLGIFLAADMGLYTATLDDWLYNQAENYAINLASHVLERYTAVNLGNLTDSQLPYTGRNFTDEEISGWYGVDAGSWDYRIEDEAGVTLESTVSGDLTGASVLTFSFNMSNEYPVHVLGTELAQFDDSGFIWRDYYCTQSQEHYLYYFPSPIYTVTILMQPGAFSSYSELSMEMITALFDLRFWMIGILAVSLLIFIACAVYLCFAAGRSVRDDQLRLAGLNRMPLDLYAAIAFGGSFLLVMLALWILEFFFFTGSTANLYSLIPVSAIMLAAATLIIGFAYAAAAQFKMRDGTWWRRSILGKLLRKLWHGVRFCFRGLQRLVNMLPLIWQWLLTAALMAFVPGLLYLFAHNNYGFFGSFWAFLLFVSLLCDIAIVCYGAYAFGTLLRGAKRMAEGNLNTKIDTKYLFGCFADFANALNALADAAVVAAKNQTRSERMKTELITNVSHDIKTPLTSLINYVDLLQKPHTEEEDAQYLDVLSRQSLRLKKLIDDLMDMSKATTGNMSVDITHLDAAEAINQALGEFADKLEEGQLTPVFRQPEHRVSMQADGRLTWRVLSNLLSNIVKYALPGTRVYIDLTQLDGQVLISLKNISREELNVSADELTERFVRGDASRNTEGSGLGLNIAKSLMELQKGQLQLLVDGDLFKVTLTFPTS